MVIIISSVDVLRASLISMFLNQPELRQRPKPLQLISHKDQFYGRNTWVSGLLMYPIAIISTNAHDVGVSGACPCKNFWKKIGLASSIG